MKKILIFATLALVLVVTAVACTGTNQPADTTADTTVETTADTEATTEVGTQAEVQTNQEDATATDTATEEATEAAQDDTTTESEVVTDAQTDAQTSAPAQPEELYVFKELTNMVKCRMDVFYLNGENYFADYPNADMADQKLESIGNTITLAEGAPAISMGAFGWIGFDQPIESYGYYIDKELTFDPDFTYIGEDDAAVKGAGAGGQYAVRYKITIPLHTLTQGVHDVGFVAKLADGTVVQIHGLMVVLE